MRGKLDRGPVEFKSHIVQHEGEVMALATREVVSIPPTQSIITSVIMMTGCGFRRLPVTDPGTKKLLGIVTSGDIISFMGGGDKYRLVKVRHNGNLIAAVNESVRTIMTGAAQNAYRRCASFRCPGDHHKEEDRGHSHRGQCWCSYRHPDGTRCIEDACRGTQPALG